MPIKQVLTKLEISGRLALWAVELGAYQISYLPRNAIKGQVLADYLAEMSGKGAGAGLVLASPSGEEHTYVLRFNFDVTNTEAEYKALLAGLNIARKMDITKLRAFTDSQLVENQFNGSFEEHDSSMQKYLQMLKELIVWFEHFELAQWAIDIVGPFPAGPGNVKFLIVAIDYFTKWVEAKAVGTITGVQFTSVAHPQANGLCEVTNRDIVSGIKKRLYEKRTDWVDELPNVLWAHRTTFKKSTGETPFSLVYGSEVVIPAEILVPTHRVTNFDEEANGEALCENLNLVEERRLMAAIREANNKHQIAKYYNKRVRALSFDVGEWVVRNNDASRAEKLGKLGPNWEGPYQVVAINAAGSYKLADIEGRTLLNAWHAALLKRYYA
ncbi:uncharacterized protein [Rutidosis leptorrhynchoides]|uniref:uncharacterized protein n=1 Tax=Rutidosis leptorrhynchoides TaxID=125765 RepID=UPI003A9A2205